MWCWGVSLSSGFDQVSVGIPLHASQGNDHSPIPSSWVSDEQFHTNNHNKIKNNEAGLECTFFFCRSSGNPPSLGGDEHQKLAQTS